MARVRASVQQSSKRSAFKHAAALGLSDRSVRKILYKDRHMHPYKMMVTQELNKRDFETRRAVCEEIPQNIPPGAVFISSDAAHFHFSGDVNKHNIRYWAAENPQEFHQRPLHSTCVCLVRRFRRRWPNGNGEFKSLLSHDRNRLPI